VLVHVYQRLEVPCLLWTAFYWVTWDAAGPILAGRRPPWPPATLWLSGFVHLWFLQFLVVGAVVTYPFIRLIVRHQWLRWWIFSACLATAFAYGTWTRPSLQAWAASGWVGDADLSLRVAIEKTIAYATYIPVGVAIALSADAIGGLYRRRWFGILTVAVLAAAMTVHLTSAAPRISRLLYSSAVFVVLLRPWKPGALAWLGPAARYSYPIYILHSVVALGVGALVQRTNLAPSLAGLVVLSVAVFAVAGVVAASLRALLPEDWFLPLIPVRMSRRRGAAPPS
jgi:hypothetical protein